MIHSYLAQPTETAVLRVTSLGRMAQVLAALFSRAPGIFRSELYPTYLDTIRITVDSRALASLPTRYRVMAVQTGDSDRELSCLLVLHAICMGGACEHIRLVFDTSELCQPSVNSPDHRPSPTWTTALSNNFSLHAMPHISMHN